MQPAVLSSLLVAMILTFDELIVSLFVSSARVRPVAVQMWSNLLGDFDPTISAIASVCFLLALLVLLADPGIARRPQLEDRVNDSAVLELAGVSKRYGQHVAVDALALGLRSGEFLTLLGPSGSGKTTTLMMVAGLQQPDAGTIWLNGASVADLPPYRRDIGMVFQHYALFPHMTVRRNVGFPLEMRRLPASEIARLVDEALELVRLPGLGDRLPKELSGGQQQRVALARALVYRPALLLMDEPLGALDRKLREQLQLEIKRVHRERGISVLYVTHDQEEALTMSDRIAVFNAGPRRADRHARGTLRPARHALRGELYRRHQSDCGPRRLGRRRHMRSGDVGGEGEGGRPPEAECGLGRGRGRSA